MTKEELEKEAYDYADKYWGASPCVIRALKETYINSAEPREKRITELEKENAELQEKLNIRSCQNCKDNNKSCPNDGSCHNFSFWRPFKNSELNKAKELIGELISSLSVVGECGEEECELLNRAEQFLKENIELKTEVFK